MYREVIEKVPSFKDQHPDLLAMVVTNLRPEYYMAGDVVSCQGDPPGGMYIIGDGNLEARTYEIQDDHDSSLLLAASTDQDLLGWPYEKRGKLTQPGFWGHVTALEGLPSPVTLVATTFCEIFVLPTDDLEEVRFTQQTLLVLLHPLLVLLHQYSHCLSYDRVRHHSLSLSQVLERFPEVKDLLLPPSISEAIQTHSHLFGASMNLARSSPTRRSQSDDRHYLTAREVESFIIRVDYPSLIPVPNPKGGPEQESEGAVLSARSLASKSIGRQRQMGNESEGYDQGYESMNGLGRVPGRDQQEGSFSVRFAPDLVPAGTSATDHGTDEQGTARASDRDGSIRSIGSKSDMSKSFTLKRNSVRQKNAVGGIDPTPPHSSTSASVPFPPPWALWPQNPDPYEGTIEQRGGQGQVSSFGGAIARASVETPLERSSQPSLAKISRKSHGSIASFAPSAPKTSLSYGRSALAAAHTSSFMPRPSTSSYAASRSRSAMKNSSRTRENRDDLATSSIEMTTASHDEPPPAYPPPLLPPPPAATSHQQGASRRSTAPPASSSMTDTSPKPTASRFSTIASKRRAELLMTPLSSDGEEFEEEEVKGKESNSRHDRRTVE